MASEPNWEDDTRHRGHHACVIQGCFEELKKDGSKELSDALHGYAWMDGEASQELWNTVCAGFCWDKNAPGHGDPDGVGDWLSLAISVCPSKEVIGKIASDMEDNLDEHSTETPLRVCVGGSEFVKFTPAKLAEHASKMKTP